MEENEYVKVDGRIIRKKRGKLIGGLSDYVLQARGCDKQKILDAVEGCIPNRHCPEAGGYDYNTLSEYEKGQLDGIDLIITDDSCLTYGNSSLLWQAVDHAYEQMSALERACFDTFKDNLVEHVERYINATANELYTSMCENDKKENAPIREYSGAGAADTENS